MSDETIIVVPCYNEARRLDVPAFDAFLRRPGEVSLLFVDDGSRDGTLEVLEQLRGRHPQRVSVFRSERNRGKAEAVRRGVLLALRRGPQCVGYWDADLATPLEAIERFRTVLDQQPERLLVMGSRVALLGRRIERRASRHYLGRAFATAASWTLGLAVYDTQCGAKLFRATPETAALFERPFGTRWIFDVELLARLTVIARQNGGPPVEQLVYEQPLDRWTDVAGSRLRPHDFLLAAADLAAIWWRYTRRGARWVAAPPAAHLPTRRKAA